MTDRVKRNVADVPYSELAGDRPMREVLAERKHKHMRQTRAVREDAYRKRAQMQVALLMCLCCYPLVIAETESEHEDWCPSHGLWLSRKAAEQHATQPTKKENNDGT